MSIEHENLTNACHSGLTLEELMVNQFRAYVSPVLSLIGIPTNFLTMVVLGIMQYHNPCRFNLYAIWLALTYNIQLIDNCFLDDFLGRGLYWATNCRFWIPVDTFSSVSCKTLTFFSESSALIKALVMMYFSADRVFSVYFPSRVPVTGGLWYAIGGILACYFIGFALNIPQLIYVDRYEESPGEYNCGYVNPLSPGVQYVLYLYIVGSTLIPSVFVSITNTLIVSRMWLISKKTSSEEEKPDLESSIELSKIIAHLAISILFQLLSIPLVVAIILRQQVSVLGLNQTQPAYAKRIVQLTKLFSSIDCINYSFEFFAFVIFMPTFRQTLWRLCRCSPSLIQSESAEWTDVTQSLEKLPHNKPNSPTLCDIRNIHSETGSQRPILHISVTPASEIIVTRL